MSESLYFAFKVVYNQFNNTIKTDGIIKNPKNKKEYKSIKFVWDTGAQTSCINEHIVEKLDLLRLSKINIRTASGEHQSFLYHVDIILPNKVTIKDLLVSGLPLEEGTDVLIGMDIISTGSFLFTTDIHSKKYVFQFSFPPLPRLDDFIEKSNKRNERNIKNLRRENFLKKKKSKK